MNDNANLNVLLEKYDISEEENNVNNNNTEISFNINNNNNNVDILFDSSSVSNVIATFTELPDCTVNLVDLFKSISNNNTNKYLTKLSEVFNALSNKEELNYDVDEIVRLSESNIRQERIVVVKIVVLFMVQNISNTFNNLQNIFMENVILVRARDVDGNIRKEIVGYIEKVVKTKSKKGKKRDKKKDSDILNDNDLNIKTLMKITYDLIFDTNEAVRKKALTAYYAYLCYDVTTHNSNNVSKLLNIHSETVLKILIKLCQSNKVKKEELVRYLCRFNGKENKNSKNIYSITTRKQVLKLIGDASLDITDTVALLNNNSISLILLNNIYTISNITECIKNNNSIIDILPHILLNVNNIDKIVALINLVKHDEKALGGVLGSLVERKYVIEEVELIKEMMDVISNVIKNSKNIVLLDNYMKVPRKIFSDTNVLLDKYMEIAPNKVVVLKYFNIEVDEYKNMVEVLYKMMWEIKEKRFHAVREYVEKLEGKKEEKEVTQENVTNIENNENNNVGTELLEADKNKRERKFNTSNISLDKTDCGDIISFYEFIRDQLKKINSSEKENNDKRINNDKNTTNSMVNLEIDSENIYYALNTVKTFLHSYITKHMEIFTEDNPRNTVRLLNCEIIDKKYEKYGEILTKVIDSVSNACDLIDNKVLLFEYYLQNNLKLNKTLITSITSKKYSKQHATLYSVIKNNINYAHINDISGITNVISINECIVLESMLDNAKGKVFREKLLKKISKEENMIEI